MDGGDLEVNWNQSATTSSWARATFTNGVLQIGSATTPRNVSIGKGPFANVSTMGELKLAPGMILDAYIQDLTIGSGYGGGGTLDLRGCVVSNGVLRIQQDLRMGLDGNGGTAKRDMFILLDDATQLNEIRIGRNFDYPFHQQYTCRIGNPANNYQLPPNLGFRIGSPASRGHFRMANSPYTGDVSVKLVATSGGYFIGYLTNAVFHSGMFGTGPSTETLFDIRAMTNVLLDVTGEFSIAKARATGNEKKYTPLVRLCPGSVTCSNVVIGTSPVASSLATLELNGTVFTATNSVEIGQYGKVTVNVSGTNCGLDLPHLGLPPGVA